MLASSSRGSIRAAASPSSGAADISAALRRLVPSAQPAVVFSSLAALCVPAFSDACTVDIVEQGQLAYRIARYRDDFAPANSPAGLASDWNWSVSVPFSVANPSMAADIGLHNADAVDPWFSGVMTHRWRSRRPTATQRARAAVFARHGTATVAWQRHLDRCARNGTNMIGEATAQ